MENKKMGLSWQFLKIFLISLCLSGCFLHTQKAQAGPRPLYPILHEYVKDFYKEFKKIPEERRYRLNEIADYIKNQKEQKQAVNLLFIGSNQSATSGCRIPQVAAFYYRVDEVSTFSAGINPGEIRENAIFALERAGFIIYKNVVNGGTLYKVKYSYNLAPTVVFPKKINHVRNPRSNFMAVMTDANADLNLPIVKGTVYRLFIDYNDPIGADGTENEKEVYDESCRQMALEMFYVFSQLKPKAN